MRVEPVAGRTFWTDACARIEFTDLAMGDRFLWMDNLRCHPLREQGQLGERVPVLVVQSVGVGFVNAEVPL